VLACIANQSRVCKLKLMAAQSSHAPKLLQMEVGIEDCLHIEFEYDRARYHLNDVVVGKIYFLLVSAGGQWWRCHLDNMKMGSEKAWQNWRWSPHSHTHSKHTHTHTHARAHTHMRAPCSDRLHQTPGRPQVRIKLKHMEVEIRRKETVGAGASAHSELETLAKYEIMDGAPVRGESVPIRCAYEIMDGAPVLGESVPIRCAGPACLGQGVVWVCVGG